MSATATLALHQDERWRRGSVPAQHAASVVADLQWDESGVAIVSCDMGQAWLGCSESTWWRSINAAQDEGLVEKVSTGGGRGRANRYRITSTYQAFPRRQRPADNRPPPRPRNPVTPAPPTERSSPLLLTRRDGSRPRGAGDGVFRSTHRPAQRYDRPWGTPVGCPTCRDQGVVLPPVGDAHYCPDCRGGNP